VIDAEQCGGLLGDLLCSIADPLNTRESASLLTRQGLTGLDNAICRHDALLEIRSKDPGLANSLAHLHANQTALADRRPPKSSGHIRVAPRFRLLTESPWLYEIAKRASPMTALEAITHRTFTRKRDKAMKLPTATATARTSIDEATGTDTSCQNTRSV
jgi:hypothetical protein